ncbi:uncharacterized protein BO80DRAFT_444069 [Aspergillus ibericus CBS 121593]|uniref:Uncharacterized protein n=1 Tax=Aspergillus ibericus CBS 121593 TaxID=1448316 RepID=A0A395H311_9EURO|nr:hypothetical protein BO80DRAFT_444069 [Aspergillus ibericus CBS 121593]RAL01809.1 hypothetical protein BO80DRAFT_444069 [Aspergillus ibericus CBS 121593]
MGRRSPRIPFWIILPKSVLATIDRILLILRSSQTYAFHCLIAPIRLLSQPHHDISSLSIDGSHQRRNATIWSTSSIYGMSPKKPTAGLSLLRRYVEKDHEDAPTVTMFLRACWDCERHTPICDRAGVRASVGM